jgi:hypothetical protein
MDIHKDCYSAIDLTQQGGPHRRETLEVPGCRFKCRVKIARTGTRIWLSVLAPFDRDSVCSAVIDTSLGDREISRHGVPARIMILQRDRMPFGESLELV